MRSWPDSIDERSESESFSALDGGFAESMGRWLASDDPIALLFSGGVDSGLLAWELRRRRTVTLVTVGVAGSPDLRAAKESAKLLGLPWSGIELTRPEVLTSSDRIRRAFPDRERTARSVLVAFTLAVERAPARTVLCGQGADELFLGYAHFRDLDARAAGERSAADLRVLLERDWPSAQALARGAQRGVVAPYLAPGFLSVARAVPIPWRLPRGEPKAFFRRWAMHRGLPRPVALRPKRALQYGSGVDRFVPGSGPDDG